MVSHFVRVTCYSLTKPKHTTRILLRWNLNYLKLSTGYPDLRDDTIPIETALVDDARIQHIQDHLAAIRDARK